MYLWDRPPQPPLFFFFFFFLGGGGRSIPKVHDEYGARKGVMEQSGLRQGGVESFPKRQGNYGFEKKGVGGVLKSSSVCVCVWGGGI